MRYIRALILSLTIHAIALLVFWLMAGKPSATLPETKTTVVDLMETPELARRPHQEPKNEKEFVRKAEAPPELRAKEKRDARFASEDEQYVLQEQQARASGMTANRSTAVGEQQKPKPSRRSMDFKPENPLRKLAEREIASQAAGDIEVAAKKQKPQETTDKQLDFSRFGSLERGMSTVGEQLPDDIKFGDFTALNTDRHLYYSFYSRIEEMVRGRWVNYAKATVFGIENGTEPLKGRASFTTKIEVILDKDGTFTRAILHESSGSKGLDSAPVQAFRDAQQFPHPPAEMVKEDGMIHIYYAFSVNMVPRYAAGGGDDGD